VTVTCGDSHQRGSIGVVSTLDVETPHGPGRAHIHSVDEPRGAVVLGHGAAGGVTAPDLVAATEAALAERFTVALVEQPYRVAGRRSPAPAHQLDASWVAVLDELRAGPLEGLALVTGGRSLGARVACRTHAATGSVGVLCLAFPLRPPRRSGEAPSRLPELDSVTVPVLVVQGDRDRFGIPPGSRARRVVRVEGDHGLKRDLPGIEAAVRNWLSGLNVTTRGSRATSQT
jgi:uncharacterized protein